MDAYAARKRKLRRSSTRLALPSARRSSGLSQPCSATQATSKAWGSVSYRKSDNVFTLSTIHHAAPSSATATAADGVRSLSLSLSYSVQSW